MAVSYSFLPVATLKISDGFTHNFGRGLCGIGKLRTDQVGNAGRDCNRKRERNLVGSGGKCYNDALRSQLGCAEAA